jgi:hypothetical protein
MQKYHCVVSALRITYQLLSGPAKINSVSFNSRSPHPQQQATPHIHSCINIQDICTHYLLPWPDFKYTHCTPHPQQQATPPHPRGLHRYTAFTMQSMRCAHCDVDEGEGVSLKACKSCMLVKYCNRKCQRNHWPKHKKPCKQRAAELHDEALFKEPPSKKDCPICFLPMPEKLINCVSLPLATLYFVPTYGFAEENEGFVLMDTEVYFTCCGKCICKGCVHSLRKSGNHGKCPYCNSNRVGKTDEEMVQEIMKRVEANDASKITIKQLNYGLGQQILVVVRRILTCLMVS